MGVDPTTFSERPRWDPPWSVRCAAKYFTVQLASGKSIEQTDRDAVLQKSEEIAKEAKRTADREAVQEQAERFRSEEEKRIAAKKVSDAKEAIEEYLRNKAEADHQAKLKATCVVIRKATIDRKVSDLTVRETQQVKACQALGIY